MSTLTDSAQSAEHLNGMIVLTMRSGSEVRFPVALTPPTEAQREPGNGYAVATNSLDLRNAAPGVHTGQHSLMVFAAVGVVRFSGSRPVDGLQSNLSFRFSAIIEPPMLPPP